METKTSVIALAVAAERLVSARLLAAALAVVLAGASGCAGPDQTEAPIDPCTRDVIYWLQERSPDQGYDYQEMGLTATSYDALRAVQAWLAEDPQRWPGAADRAALECRERRSDPHPGGAGRAGWPGSE